MSMEPPVQQQDPTPPAPVGIDQLTKALTDAVAAGRQQAVQQPPQQQQQLSPEQIAQMLRAPVIDPQRHIEAMFGQAATNEGRMSALMELLTMAAQHGASMADYKTQHYFNQYHENLAPDLGELRHIAEGKFYDELYDGHPNLKQYDPFVKQLLPTYRTAEDYPKERRDQPKYAREKILAAIKAQQPDFDPSGQPAQTTSPSTPQRQPTSTPAPNSMAAGGGGPSARQPAPAGAGPTVNRGMGF